MFKLAIICGGPTPERGISLNSARSVMDHLSSSSLEIIPLYVDDDKNFYKISCGQLYSNTPADFDFKLHQTATKLDSDSLKTLLKQVDLAFPTIHGPFGEDGELQRLLESMEIPFVGSSSSCCSSFFHKYRLSQLLKQNGYQTLPSLLIKKGDPQIDSSIRAFFATHRLERAIIKPVVGGSSIGVSSVSSPEQTLLKCLNLFSQECYQEALLEPFCVGTEFTVLVVESAQGESVALMPTEIEIEYTNNQIFDYRKKYLPTNQAAYHTPPRFEIESIREIRKQAQEIFRLLRTKDFGRLDGWLLPDGSLLFTDFNPISGMEQNSFLFRQASMIGMSHRDILQHVVATACHRYGIPFSHQTHERNASTKNPVFVLFGGHNAERQVSLMSGTNVWLKLRQSNVLEPTPFLYDAHGDIWELPYSYTLNHTVEEVYQSCLAAGNSSPEINQMTQRIQQQLEIQKPVSVLPKRLDRSSFFKQAKQQNAFVFIAMHGGVGEDGTLQAFLEKEEIQFNGSDSKASALCMDKYLAGEAIQQLNDPEIISLSKTLMNQEIVKNYSPLDYEALWDQLTESSPTSLFLVKPRCDGCSAGIALLRNAEDLTRYVEFIRQEASFIPTGTFYNQKVIIEMPAESGDYIIEPYIETDQISIEHRQLHHHSKEGWVELTVGVLEENGNYHALQPSITIAEGAVLSLEEKFQGGTGVNLTPPPASIVSSTATRKIRRLVEKSARALGILNYSRIDIFFNLHSEKIIIIEANSLPGLTPSTVIYHQGLAEDPPLNPTAFLEKIIALKKASLQSLPV